MGGFSDWKGFLARTRGATGAVRVFGATGTDGHFLMGRLRVFARRERRWLDGHFWMEVFTKRGFLASERRDVYVACRTGGTGILKGDKKSPGLIAPDPPMRKITSNNSSDVFL